jgi:ribosomal protein S18 acetylase RimI-like enzyme
MPTKWKAEASIGMAFTRDSQKDQYPALGDPGISYFAGVTPDGNVDCLLYRDVSGEVIGILNYYSIDFPPWETAGSANVWVDPKRQREGIGTALWLEAVARYNVDPTVQRYTNLGAKFINSLMEKGLVNV